MNINLNAGGFIGAILGGRAALLYAAFAYNGLTSNVSSSQLGASSSLVSRAFIFTVIAGALIGTTLWSAIFGQKKQS